MRRRELAHPLQPQTLGLRRAGKNGPALHEPQFPIRHPVVQGDDLQLAVLHSVMEALVYDLAMRSRIGLAPEIEPIQHRPRQHEPVMVHLVLEPIPGHGVAIGQKQWMDVRLRPRPVIAVFEQRAAAVIGGKLRALGVLEPHAIGTPRGGDDGGEQEVAPGEVRPCECFGCPHRGKPPSLR